MNLQEIMQYNNFTVLGNTENPEKYAYKIKEELIQKGYTVACVDKQYKSINDVPFDIDVLDICMNPAKAYKLIEETTKNIKAAILQPGAESEELKNLLSDKQIPYIEGCALVGLRLYAKKSQFLFKKLPLLFHLRQDTETKLLFS